jgi:hypothetical protein
MPFAISLALNKTAKLVVDAQVKEMQDVFDRPTPWTLKGVGSQPSTKTDLRAFVFLKDRSAVSSGHPADVYLAPQIRGGDRNLKAFELAFRSAGVLPSSYFMVPGQGASMDQYGNMNRGQIVQLLSYFRALGSTYQAGFTGNRRKDKRTPVGYFAAQPGGHLTPGIYERVTFAGGSKIKPLIIFVDAVHYEAIYDFNFVGKTTVEREFPAQLAAATQYAIKTAR